MGLNTFVPLRYCSVTGCLLPSTQWPPLQGSDVRWRMTRQVDRWNVMGECDWTLTRIYTTDLSDPWRWGQYTVSKWCAPKLSDTAQYAWRMKISTAPLWRHENLNERWATAKTSSEMKMNKRRVKQEKKRRRQKDHMNTVRSEKRGGGTESSWNKIFKGEKRQVGATMWQICSTGHPWKNQEGHPQKIYMFMIINHS